MKKQTFILVMLLLPLLSFAEKKTDGTKEKCNVCKFFDKHTYAFDDVEFVFANKDITLGVQYNAMLGITLDKKKKFALLLSPFSFKLAFQNRSSSLTSIAAGGGLSYNIYRAKKYNNLDLDLEATVRRTFSGIIGWHYTEYNVGFRRIHNKFNDKFKGGALGYRYLKSHTTGISDLHAVYVSFSF